MRTSETAISPDFYNLKLSPIFSNYDCCYVSVADGDTDGEEAVFPVASAGSLWRHLHSVLETGPYADYMQPPCTHVEIQSGTICVYKKKYPGNLGGKRGMGGESDKSEFRVKGGFLFFSCRRDWTLSVACGGRKG